GWVLNFSCGAASGRLRLLAYNNGWGPAEALHISASEPLLDQLFDAAPRSNVLRVEAGAGAVEALELALPSARPSGLAVLDEAIDGRRALLATLPKRMMSRDASVLVDPRYKAVLSARERWHLGEYFDDLARGEPASAPRQRWHIEYLSGLDVRAVPINTIDVRYTFTDATGTSIDDAQQALMGTNKNDDGEQLWVSRTGFTIDPPSPLCAAPMIPSIAVTALLENVTGPSERSYRISPTIPPGTPERFFVVVGADRSCFVRARFTFHFDGDQTMISEPFDLAIWRPRNVVIKAKDGSQFIHMDGQWRLADEASDVARLWL
ncbi:hypothetical protein BE04_12510, partial [Sorangium cellulosum]